MFRFRRFPKLSHSQTAQISDSVWNTNQFVRNSDVWLIDSTNRTFSGMLKSEGPKSKQCWNLNNRSFEQNCSDFGLLGSFDRLDFGIHSIRMPIMPKSERSNRIVRISMKFFVRNLCRSFRFRHYFLFEPNLVPNREALSEIRTRSDFSIPLYRLLDSSPKQF